MTEELCMIEYRRREGVRTLASSSTAKNRTNSILLLFRITYKVNRQLTLQENHPHGINLVREKAATGPLGLHE
jgi:hypothetical protein